MYNYSHAEYLTLVPFESTVDNKLIYVNIRKIITIDVIDMENDVKLEINCGKGNKSYIKYHSRNEAVLDIRDAFRDDKKLKKI